MSEILRLAKQKCEKIRRKLINKKEITKMYEKNTAKSKYNDNLIYKDRYDEIPCDDDEDDKYGILPNYRILKNIDFASEGLIMFMYKDALQRLHKPFVMTDNISNIFDIQQKRININRLINTVPMGSSINVGTEIVTGSNINELIKE